MRNLIHKMKVNQFVFETGGGSVTMDCEITKNNKIEKLKYQISQTDLNALITKLTKLGLNVMDFCKSYSIDRDQTLYEIDLRTIEDQKRLISKVSFYNPAIKIQA